MPSLDLLNEISQQLSLNVAHCLSRDMYRKQKLTALVELIFGDILGRSLKIH